MATVYLAHDVKHGRRVAIKVLQPELAAMLGAERFLREIEIAARLSHPHILPLHDSGEVDGHLFYVMPYIEGESLRARLTREHQLPVDEAVRLAQQVASALDYAHRRMSSTATSSPKIFCFRKVMHWSPTSGLRSPSAPPEASG